MKLLLSGLLFFSAASSSAAAENWPGFRGPTRQGLSGETGLPLKWSASENVAWKTGIAGESWSSPIVWGDRVFVTTATEGGASCHVLAIDRRSGKVLWNKEVFKQETLLKEQRNTYATPTPVTDGRLVYAVFGDGSFAALDFAGETAWTNRDFKFYSRHGLGTSPILWEDLLIMARDGSSDGPDKDLGWHIPWDRSFVLALDKRTGKMRWKAGRGLSRIAHVCPNIWIDPSGRAQVVSGAGDVVQAHDALTGELLWTSENKGEGVVPSVVLGDGLVFTACGWAGRESIKAFRPGGKGDLKETNLAWEQRKGMPKIPSYLYRSPYLFAITDGGVASCLKGETGQLVWQQRLEGNYTASPVCAEGRIYFTSDEGETTIIEARPEFKVLARNPLHEKVQASIAISGHQLFIRTERHLYCIGGPG
ncbi:MAG: PQQ-binding-like beta-propeller repeat protein [Planctomycetes bacterium]|nr:PQQ-binding-like beta-propeller repeat protein [Planctomycetota bacterium]